jgi:type IV pilus assembly protein PilA
MLTRNEKGFTLIELMIVIAIIGILAAIAIPQFSAYRLRAYNAGAESQCRNIGTAMEGYFADKETYVGADEATLAASYGYQADAGITVTIVPTATTYTITTASTKAGATVYTLAGPGGKITHP